MRDWFRRFMQGRYGFDALSLGLLFMCALISMIVKILPESLNFLLSLSFIPLIFYFYRIFSRDIYKRRMENEKFLKKINSFIMHIKKERFLLRDRKIYKYFKCPNCKQKLRIPRGQGKVTITCPKCKHTFKGKA